MSTDGIRPHKKRTPSEVQCARKVTEAEPSISLDTWLAGTQGIDTSTPARSGTNGRSAHDRPW